MKSRTKEKELELTLAKYIKKCEEQNEEIRRLNKIILGHSQAERIYNAYLTYAFGILGKDVPEGMKAPDGTERRDGDIYAEIDLEKINELVKDCCMQVMRSEDGKKALIYLRRKND